MGAAAARWETVLREEEEQETAALRACACRRRSVVAAARVGDGCACAGAMRSVERGPTCPRHSLGFGNGISDEGIKE
jgi:hypothetical protein